MDIVPQNYEQFKLKRLIVWYVLFFIVLNVLAKFGIIDLDYFDNGPLPITEILFYIVAIVWIWFYTQKNGLTIRKIINPGAFQWRQMWSLHLVLPMFVFSIVSMLLIQHFFPVYFEAAPETVALDSWVSRMGNFVILVILAPIIEEIIFRKALLYNWARHWSVIKAVLFTSVLFGILHFDILGGVVFGLVTAFLSLKFRNLIPNIVIHALYNLIVFAFMVGVTGQSEDTEPLTRESLIVISAILVFTIAWIAIALYKHRPVKTDIIQGLAN